MTLARVPITVEEYVEYLNDYIDRVLETFHHRAVSRTSWRIEDISDILLDLRNEVTVLGVAAEVSRTANG